MESEKEHWRNGIVVPREKVEDYIEEADAILIGPGLPREEGLERGDDDTREVTERLLKKYPHKKWVVDGGSLQTIAEPVLPPNCILTPHRMEFEKLFGSVIPAKAGIQSKEWIPGQARNDNKGLVAEMAKKYGVVILLKGQVDIVCSPNSCVNIPGGNAGMTKGGTGDVLAGLTAALYAQNDDAFLVAQAASYINKKAGESLYEKVGLYFNASDLVGEIPKVMKELLLSC
jgi:NAD(P)H-hydrate epimerase